MYHNLLVLSNVIFALKELLQGFMGAKASSQIIERFATLPFVIPELLMKSIGIGVMIAPTVVLSLLAGLLALHKGLPVVIKTIQP